MNDAHGRDENPEGRDLGLGAKHDSPGREAVPQTSIRMTPEDRTQVERVAHEYVPSRVGHGETQCKWCFGTNRENAIIAPNHCETRAAKDPTLSAPAEPSAALSERIAKLLREDPWNIAEYRGFDTTGIANAVAALSASSPAVAGGGALKAALKPFADLADFLDEQSDPRWQDPDDEFQCGDFFYTLGVGQLHAARAAYTALTTTTTATASVEVVRTLAAGRIIDIMCSGSFDWRSRLEDSDFLESADWLTALAYADAAISTPSGEDGK